MADEFDAIADKLFVKNQKAPDVANVDPIEDEFNGIADKMFGSDESNFKQAAFVAKQKEPERMAEAIKLSKQYNVPATFVEENLELFKKETTKDPLDDYEGISSKSPKLAKWMEDPVNATMAKDDIEILSEVENYSRRIMPYVDKPGYLSDLNRAKNTGFDNLSVASYQLRIAYGMMDPSEGAETIAALNAKINKEQQELPKYVKEFNQVMAKEGGDVDKAFATFVGSFEKIKNDNILEGLGEFASGGAMTIAQFVDQMGAWAVRPKAAARAVVESLPFSAPSLLSGAAGAKVGAVAGSVLPGVLTAAGAIGGFAVGTFSGGAVTEVGAWINSSLAERGYDTSNVDDLKRAYSNPKLMAEVRGEAQRKGVTTAGIDALFSIFAGRLVKGAKGKGVVKKAKAFAGDTAIQATGEGASEFGGQVAAREGDLSQVSLGEAITEGITSLGHSMGEVAIGSTIGKAKQAGVKINNEFSPGPIQSAQDIVTDVHIAQESIIEIQSLEKLGELAAESKVNKRSPEAFAELVSQDTEGQSVYFQKDDWDKYWSEKGESPVQKAEELLGADMSTYDNASETGQPIEIPMKDYVTKLGPDEVYKELLEIAKTQPDGMTAREAADFMKELPETMETLAKEAVAFQKAQKTLEESARVIKNNISDQLKAVGRNPIEGVPVVEFYKILGLKEGIAPDKLFAKYGLTVNQATEGTKNNPNDETFFQSQVYKKEGFKFSEVEKDENETYLIKSFDKKGNQVGVARLVEENGVLRPDDVNFDVAISVKEEHRRKGIGFELYKRAEEQLGLPIIHRHSQTSSGSALQEDREKSGIAFNPTEEFELKLEKLENKILKNHESIESFLKDGTKKEITKYYNALAERDFAEDIQQGMDFNDLASKVERARNADKQDLPNIEQDLSDFKARQKAKLKQTKLILAKAKKLSKFKWVRPEGENFFNIIDNKGNKVINDALKDKPNDQKFRHFTSEKMNTSSIARLEVKIKEFNSGKNEKDFIARRSDKEQEIEDFKLKESAYHFKMLALNSDRESFIAKNIKKKNQPEKTFAQDKRGQIRIANNKFNIDLFKTADKSTFIHESGHYFLEVMKDMTSLKESSQELKDDFKAILDWMGVESADKIETKHHEMWARGFEAYLREGKAPNSKLRKAFNTFKVWLTSIYKSSQDLNVEMNDDIRSVMDRMFATQDEINQAKQSLGDMPLFPNPIEMGMSKDKASKYKDAIAEATLKANEDMQAKLMAHDERKKKKSYVIARREIKVRVTDEVNKLPLYNNIAILRDGKLADGSSLPVGSFPVKLSKAEFDSKFPEMKGNPKFKGMFSDKGIESDIVARMLGYKDGKQLVNEVASSIPKKELIKQGTESELQKQIPDLLKDESIAEQAEQMVHNENRAKRLQLEYEYLATNNKSLAKEIIQKVTRRPTPQKAIKELATKTIGKLKVSQIKPNTYRLAERRHAKEAGIALSKGDVAASFDSKQKELLNHYLYKASTEAKQKINKSVKDVKKYFDKDEKIAKTRDMDFVSTARAVLSRYGLGFSNKDPIEHIAKIKEYNPDAYETIAAMITGIIKDPADYKSISYDQFTDLIQATDALWFLAKDIKQIEVDGKKVDIATANEELIEKMQIFIKPKAKAKYAKTASDQDKFRVKLLGLKASARRYEHWIDVMDLDAVDGPFRRFLFTGASEATDKFLLLNKEYKQKLIEISAPIKEALDVNEVIQSDEIGFEFKNKAELLGALIHTGNKGSLRKLLVGREWGSLDEDNNLVRDKWDKFIQRMWDDGILTETDYDYAQSLWDLMEEIKPMAQKAHKKVFGFFFNEITANEIKTPFGTYRGGYAPAKVDPMAVTDIAKRNELEEFVKGHQSYTYPASGGKGFTLGRVEFNKPLNLDIGLVTKHVEDVLRFSIIKPAVVDTAKVILSKDFKEAMAEIDPVVIDQLIKPTLNRADKNSNRSQNPNVPALARWFGSSFRSASSMQLMVANVVNTAEQFGGLGISATRVSPRFLARSAINYFTDFKSVSADIREKSQAMRARSDDQIFEMDKKSRSIFEEKSNFKKVKDWAHDHAFFMQSFTQNIVDNITWQASYDESVSKGLTEQQAVRKADADIRITQSSRRPMDVSNMETSEMLSFFQMFMNFFNMMANVNVSNFTKLYYEDMGMKQKFAKGMYLYSMGFATVAVVSSALRKAAAGGLDEDDDGEYSDDLFDIFIGSQKELAFAMVPILGPAVNAGLNQANDKFYDDRVSVSPAMSAITTVTGAITKGFSGKLTDGKGTRRDITDALTALGLVTGLPLKPLSKPLGYLSDVSEGNAKPKGPLDFTRGLVTGKPGVR